MKKSFFLVLCVILSISLIKAQRKQVDSLKMIISKSGEDSNRVKAFFQLGVQYQYFKPDSGIYYAQQAYTLASDIKYPSYQRRGLSLLANLYVGVGNFIKGMQIYYDALQLAQNQHDDYSIIQVYNNMGSTYNYMEDFPKGLQQLRLAQKYLTAYMAKFKKVDPKFHSIQLYILNNFGESFLGTGQLDSAEYYLKQGLLYQEKHQNYTLKNIFIGDLGILEGKKGNASAALHYFQEAENAQLKENDLTNLEPVYFSIAELYKKINKTDSAIYYAKKAFSGAREGNFLPEAARASKLLYQLYDQQHNIPLAYMYYKTATRINDSLITKEKIRAMASLDFEAKQRQLEIDAAKTAYKNTVQRYILLGGMGFLALLVFIFWRNALQRKKANNFLEKQKTEIETTLNQLKAAQTQLIQSEKMASLGELTAGIAHEIQNPLNFVK